METSQIDEVQDRKRLGLAEAEVVAITEAHACRGYLRRKSKFASLNARNVKTPDRFTEIRMSRISNKVSLHLLFLLLYSIDVISQNDENRNNGTLFDGPGRGNKNFQLGTDWTIAVRLKLQVRVLPKPD